MKSILILSVVVAVALANPVQQQWDRVHQQCQSTPGLYVDDRIFELLKAGQNPTLPDNFGSHASCMLVRLHLQEHNGQVSQNGVKHAVQRNVSNPSKVNQIVTECSINQGTKQETALKLFGCLRKHNIDIGQF